eukprot:COSAG01_NODE_3955_length_5495_cov_215.437280_3_plen_100_part_00
MSVLLCVLGCRAPRVVGACPVPGIVWRQPTLGLGVHRPHLRPCPLVHAALMGSPPGHPFWLSVLRALELEVRGLLNWGELTAVDTTGARAAPCPGYGCG